MLNLNEKTVSNMLFVSTILLIISMASLYIQHTNTMDLVRSKLLETADRSYYLGCIEASGLSFAETEYIASPLDSELSEFCHNKAVRYRTDISKVVK